MPTASQTHPSRSHLLGAATSILISTIFAVIWGINGSLALSGGWRVAALGVVAVITAALVWVALNFHRAAAHASVGADAPLPNPFLTTAYWVSVIVMLIAFPVAARTLTANGLEDAIMPAAVIIMGLHFIGLISAFRNGIYAWVAVAFCLLGIAALFLPVEIRVAVLSLGCAVILWLAMMPLALRFLGQLRQRPTPR
ncbi:hypothetical protein [Deinococcus frigens]|uniref:hypothetical protein n=1 Tax=Deinococcus frigens TaxID=249403 RepID=UPI000495B14F|nr:hypothetical protein [Deinococcus frigens]